jgi:hypothetical protein
MFHTLSLRGLFGKVRTAAGIGLRYDRMMEFIDPQLANLFETSLKAAADKSVSNIVDWSILDADDGQSGEPANVFDERAETFFTRRRCLFGMIARGEFVWNRAEAGSRISAAAGKIEERKQGNQQQNALNCKSQEFVHCGSLSLSNGGNENLFVIGYYIS